MLADYIVKLLHKVAKTEGFVDYEIDTKSGSNHGDNFLGVMTTVTISGMRKQNGHIKSETLHLLCKTPPASEIRQKSFHLDLMFDREIYMYSKLLPAFVRFQKEKGLSDADSFLSFPKKYACEIDAENGRSILIMEDLRPRNFEMWPKEKIAPIDHQLCLMRELGKFHAVSFAMKDQRPNEFAEFQSMKCSASELYLHGGLRPYVTRSVEKAASVLENPLHKKMMENFRKTFIETVCEFVNGASSKEFGIIGHGDCWNNNYLYQYADSNKTQLKGVCIVDWQLSRYCPPAMDLLYNIFSSTDKQMRKDHYKTLLETYYSSLSETMSKLGSDPNKLYTFENLQSQMRKFGVYVLMFGPVIFEIRIASAKDISNLDDYVESYAKGGNPHLVNQFDERTQKEYSTWINDLVTDLINYGYVECK